MKKDSGVISVIIIVILILVSVISLYGLRVTLSNYKTVTLNSEKSRSNSIADHGLTKYLERLVKYYETGEDKTLPLGFTENFNIMDSGKIVGNYLYSYNPTVSKIINTYVLQKRTKTKQYMTRSYNLNPPIDTEFKALVGQFDKDFAQIDVSGIYNETVNSLEFYAAVYDDREGKLKIYRYQPFIDEGFSFVPEGDILISDLYKKKSAMSTKNALSLHDDLEIEVLWNANFKSLEIYVAIGDKENQVVDVFRMNPYLDPNEYDYIDGLAVPFKQSCFSGVYDKNINDIELFITVLQDDKIKIYNSYPSLGVDGKFDATLADFADDIAVTPDTNKMDVSVLWNETLNSANLYVSVIENLGNEVGFYLFLPHINADITKQTELTMNAATMGAGFKANQIAIDSYFDKSFNAPQLYTMFGDYVTNTLKTSYRFIGENSWNTTNVVKDVKEGIGRLSICGAYSSVTEVVAINPSPIVKYLKIENLPIDFNITGTAYKHGNQTSKSEIKASVKLEFTEPELTSGKKIENIEIVDIVKN